MDRYLRPTGEVGLPGHSSMGHEFIEHVTDIAFLHSVNVSLLDATFAERKATMVPCQTIAFPCEAKEVSSR